MSGDICNDYRNHQPGYRVNGQNQVQQDNVNDIEYHVQETAQCSSITSAVIQTDNSKSKEMDCWFCK